MGEGDLEKAQRQGYTFLGLGFVLGCFAALVILLVRGPIINYYKVSAETKAITSFDHALRIIGCAVTITT